MSSSSMADNGMVVSVRKVRLVSFCRQTYKVEASAQYALDFLGWINSGTNGDNPHTVCPYKPKLLLGCCSRVIITD
jgi:hypothetical protein